jgi:hypothetical protein
LPFVPTFVLLPIEDAEMRIGLRARQLIEIGHIRSLVIAILRTLARVADGRTAARPRLQAMRTSLPAL